MMPQGPRLARVEEERFLTLPHEGVEGYIQHKAALYGRWIGGMAKLQKWRG